MKVLSADINRIISLALKEDVGTGDITTNSSVSKSTKAKATILAKQSGVIAGLPVAELICKKIDKNISFKQKVKEGMHVSSNTIIAEADGSFRTLLTVERTVLNFLQRMSGIATETSKYVQKLNGLNTKILDTRKTSPGLRLLDKYSVKIGGGVNHRIGLYDMVLIKENHISAAGGITKAVELCRKNISKRTKIEVEVSTFEDVAEALRSNVDIIMLDNMSLELMHEAVKLINGKCKIEASGGINMDTIRKVAETGVDYISVGSLTHSVTALDIAMYIKKQ